MYRSDKQFNKGLFFENQSQKVYNWENINKKRVFLKKETLSISLFKEKRKNYD